MMNYNSYKKRQQIKNKALSPTAMPYLNPNIAANSLADGFSLYINRFCSPKNFRLK
jgi:hypothetical protein